MQHEVEDYIARYNEKMQGLYYESSKAEWSSNTHIVEGDTTNAARTQRAHAGDDEADRAAQFQ